MPTGAPDQQAPGDDGESPSVWGDSPRCLVERDRPAGELAAAFPSLSQPAVSRHLRVLRDVGLVDVRVDAQRRIYRLRPDRLREVGVWLDRYREFWADRIDALEEHLRTTNGREEGSDR